MKVIRICISIWVMLIGPIGISSMLYAQQPQKLGKVRSAAITEISGIIPYSYQSGYFWVHNDSGDGPYIYLIDSTASLKAKVEIEGAKFTDIEDVGRFESKGKNYLVLADIGNNQRKRTTLSLFIIEEPNIQANEKTRTVKAKLVKEIKFRYKDKNRDAEAIFIDPKDNSLYIISKRDFESAVFRIPFDLEGVNTYSVEPLLTLPFTFTTAADISSDGKYIVAKNLTTIYFWERGVNQSVIQALSQKPKTIPYIVEPQGEAICFDLHNRFLYTISERPFGLDSYLYKYDF